MTRSSDMRNRMWIFLILPLVYMITGIFYIHHSGWHFLRCVDPEYAYLLNGIVLAKFHPNIFVVGHPGTPVLMLIAIVSHIVHLFRPGQPLIDDVMRNPELYIKASLYIANVINSFFLFLLGKFIYRYSRDFFASVILQTTPFVYLLTLELSYRLMPEMIMISIISCWIILLVKLLYETPESCNYKKYSLLFALLFGFSLADKLTFMPFFLLPLIVLPSWRFRMRYTILSVIAFLLFAFPVIFSFHRFTGWVTGILTHKGVYGLGEEGLIDLKLFAGNLIVLIKSTPQLLIATGLLVLILMYYITLHKQKDIAVRITLALIVVVLAQYIITSKHYAFYYMTPVLLLTVFTGFLASVFIHRIFPVLDKKKRAYLGLGFFVVVIMALVIPKSIKQLGNLNTTSFEKKEIYQQVHVFQKDSKKIIYPSYLACSSVEYALLFGLQYTGKHSKTLNEVVKKYYPDTYIYLPWIKSFYEGINIVKPAAFLVPHTAYSLYIADFSEMKLNEIMEQLKGDSIKFNLRLNIVYQFDESAESLINLDVGSRVDAMSGATRMY